MLLKSKIIGNGSEALIILHGFLGMSDNWNSYAKKINDKGFQIHLLDQRNHGESFHSEEFNYEILSNDLKYFKKLTMGNPIIMGRKENMTCQTIYNYLTSKL